MAGSSGSTVLSTTWPHVSSTLWPSNLVPMGGIEFLKGHGTQNDFVLLPDLYYRSGSYAPMDPHNSCPELARPVFTQQA